MKAHEFSFWSRISTWGTLLVLLFFAVGGTSPFQNGAVKLRAASTDSHSLAERALTALAYGAILLLFLPRWRAVAGRMFSVLPVVALLVLAALSAGWADGGARTLGYAAMLGMTAVFAAYLSRAYSFDRLAALMAAVGAVALPASAALALALPQYGLDQLGGHAGAWKGVFSSKNNFGQMVVLLFAFAWYQRPVSGLGRVGRVVYMAALVAALGLTQAATSYVFLALFLVYAASAHLVARFRRADMFAVAGAAAGLLAMCAALLYTYRDALLALVQKDTTLTGRTMLWSAAADSIAKHPWLGYGYQGFWRGLTGESANVALAVGNIYGQAQSGFLDTWLQLGAAGLALVLLLVLLAFRDVLGRLDLRARPALQCRVAVVLLTLAYNTDETSLLDPKHLGWVLFLTACYGLRAAAREPAAATIPGRGVAPFVPPALAPAVRVS